MGKLFFFFLDTKFPICTSDIPLAHQISVDFSFFCNQYNRFLDLGLSLRPTLLPLSRKLLWPSTRKVSPPLLPSRPAEFIRLLIRILSPSDGDVTQRRDDAQIPCRGSEE